MAKNSTIITVSVPKEFASFMDEHELSPSEILQRAIEEQMQLWKRYHTEVGKLNESINAMQGLQKDLFGYLENIEKTDEFLKWRGEHHNV